jgi:hypothetical protein
MYVKGYFIVYTLELKIRERKLTIIYITSRREEFKNKI